MRPKINPAELRRDIDGLYKKARELYQKNPDHRADWPHLEETLQRIRQEAITFVDAIPEMRRRELRAEKSRLERRLRDFVRTAENIIKFKRADGNKAYQFKRYQKDSLSFYREVLTCWRAFLADCPRAQDLKKDAPDYLSVAELEDLIDQLKLVANQREQSRDTLANFKKAAIRRDLLRDWGLVLGE